MPIELQPKLLRFIQTGEFARVGETMTRKADIRIIAATNRDPLQAVRDGKLREDLYYRLHVIPVAMPPLRERGADILLLAEDFLNRFSAEEGKAFSGFDRGAEEKLISHNWPGNVRELENLMRQTVVLNAGGEVSSEMLGLVANASAAPASVLTPEDISYRSGRRSYTPHQPGQGYSVEPLWMTEKKAIERAIALCRGNITAAAELLDINASTIYRKKATWDKTETGLEG